jgi:hypothetical protein
VGALDEFILLVHAIYTIRALMNPSNAGPQSTFSLSYLSILFIVLLITISYSKYSGIQLKFSWKKRDPPKIPSYSINIYPIK